MPLTNNVRVTAEPAYGTQGTNRLAILLVLALGLGLLLWWKRDAIFPPKSVGQKASAYQAVFLTNGQVYFGKLSDISSDFLTLTDVYYLRVEQPQPLQGTPQKDEPSAPGQAQLSLVKLGKELHGPTDLMHIGRAQVLFYEDMRPDSEVVQAIHREKAQNTRP